MSSKTPLPRMGLRTRDTDSQKHPGRPDQPRPRQSTHEVQAEKAEKATMRAKKVRLRSETIQATAKLETQMEAHLKEKLATAHHPPPNIRRKVQRIPVKASRDVAAEGMIVSL